MPSGGARNRSGPPADPRSARSDRRGVKLTALPAEGYDGPVPPWPLPLRVVSRTVFRDGVRCEEDDDDVSLQIAEREEGLWQWVWRTPQACAWAMPSESWRIPTIAMWVRTFVICESAEASAADKGSLHRFADQIGMTPAGLRENGWAIAQDEIGARRAERDTESDPEPAAEPAPKVRRLRG